MKIYRSRRYRSEPNRAKRFLAYGVIGFIIIIIFLIWGVTLIANLSNIFDSIRGSSKTAPTHDVIAPPPPHLSALPITTGNVKITISGSSEAGATITLFKNGSSAGTMLVGNDGLFSFHDLRLAEGSNSFTARAKDSSGNESAESNRVDVILDTVPPALSVDQPTDGQVVTSQFLTVSGTTDPKGIVTVNNQQQIVDATGKFSGQVTLQSGDNTVTVVATDQAGNQTKVTRKVTYSPS